MGEGVLDKLIQERVEAIISHNKGVVEHGGNLSLSRVSTQQDVEIIDEQQYHGAKIVGTKTVGGRSITLIAHNECIQEHNL